jgi:hypothetical protein
VYFLPALSHLLSFPLYMAEPMRILVILALLHTNHNNAFILAVTLPVFSTLVGGHPDVYKMVIMTIELVCNVWLFYLLSGIVKNTFFRLFSSILLSKIIYYLLKYFLLTTLLLQGKLITTPLFIQLIVSILLSAYAILIFWNKKTQ